MSKSSNGTIISDKDQKRLESTDRTLTNLVQSLKDKNRTLASLGNLLAANTANTTSFMQKIAGEVETVNKSLESTSKTMVTLEANITALSASMAKQFDNMAQKAKYALDAMNKASQASKSANATAQGSRTSSGSGLSGTWWDKWKKRAETAEEKTFSADVKDGKGTDADFTAMQKAEAEWNRIVQVSSVYLKQMTQIAVMQEKMNMATSAQYQTQLNALANITAKYEQIARLRKARAENSNFDSGTFVSTQEQKGQLQGKQINAQAGNSGLVNLQAENALLKQQLQLQRQQAMMEKSGYADQRKKTIELQQHKKELDAQIRADLEREKIEQRINDLLAKQNKTKKEYGELSELRSRLDDLNSMDTQTTKQTSNLYYNSTGQMIQIIRELPNFAISAQTGLMSLSNNLPMLMDGFISTAKAAGGVTKALKLMFSPATMLNIAFVAITMVIMNLDKIIKWLSKDTFDFGAVLDSVAEGLRNGNSELAKGIEGWEMLQQALANANVGIIDGADALDEYNRKFATTYGYAKDTAEAYKLMKKNADEYYKAVINHEIATAISKQAIKQLQEEIADQLGPNGFFTRLFKGKNSGNYIEDWVEMQENLDKLAKGEAVKGTGDNGTVAWNPQSRKYFTTLIRGIGKGDPYSKYSYTDKEAGMTYYGAYAIEKSINKALGRNIASVGNYDGKKNVYLQSKDKQIITKEEYDKIDAVLNDIMTAAVFESLANGMEEMRDKMEAMMHISSEFEQDVPTESTGKGGGGASRARQSPDLKVLQFRDRATMDKYYNERQGVLEKRNEKLERDISAPYSSGEDDMYKKRLEALSEYMRNKQELAEIGMTRDVFNANERRKKELHDLEEQRKINKARLEEYKKKLADWNAYVGSGEFSINKDKATQEQKDAQNRYNKLSDKLIKEDGIAKDSEEYKTRMKVVTDNLKKANDTLASYSKDEGARLAGIVAQSEKNLKQWEQEAENRKVQIEKNYNTDYMNAIMKGTTAMVKAREDALQKGVAMFKDNLNVEIDLVKERYEEEIRIIENHYKRLQRLREQNGALGYESAGGIASKAGETFAKGVAGYQRDSNISGIINTQDEIAKNTEVRNQAIIARSNIEYAVSEKEKQVKKFADKNALTADRKKELRSGFESDLRATGKFSDDEINEQLKQFDYAMDNVNTEEGQKAFDELSRSATKAYTNIINENEETGKRLEEQMKDQWMGAIEDMAVQTLESLMDLFDALFQAEIEYEKRAVDNWVESQNKMVEDQYKSQVIDEKEYQAQKAAIEEEQRKKNHEIAVKEEKANRVKATANVLIGTAQAITYAALSAFQTGGPAAPALFAVYAALLTASAAAQIAAIHAAPYPEYAEGTDFHKGGLAIVGDAGKSELIETRSGKLYKTPDVPTLMDIERGAKVHPDFSMAIRDFDDERQVVVLAENKKQLTLLRQTNRSLGAIVANTRTQQRNYNRIWN